MMRECSTGELLARAVFMHPDDQGHDALMHYAVLKRFILTVFFLLQPLETQKRTETTTPPDL